MSIYVSAWLQAALLPARFRVAGVSCSALTVWHSFILGCTGNAYALNDPARMDKDAASELLLYASRNHADGARLYAETSYRAKALAGVCRALAGQPWERVHAACMEYVEICRRVPGHKQPQADPKSGKTFRSLCAPFAWLLVDFLTAGDASRIEAAWDTPYAVAACLFDAHRDISGQDETLESVAESERFDAYLERQKAGAA